jgi:DNA-directed RNA polymerase specialized sigma24 family protein
LWGLRPLSGQASFRDWLATVVRNKVAEYRRRPADRVRTPGGEVAREIEERPYAEWTAQQIISALPYEKTPRFLIRDRDHSAGRQMPALDSRAVPGTHLGMLPFS